MVGFLSLAGHLEMLPDEADFKGAGQLISRRGKVFHKSCG